MLRHFEPRLPTHALGESPRRWRVTNRFRSPHGLKLLGARREDRYPDDCVPGPVAPDPPLAKGPSFGDSLSTDIAGDFLIIDPTFVVLRGVRYLFAGALNFRYGNNCDFAARWRRLVTRRFDAAHDDMTLPDAAVSSAT